MKQWPEIRHRVLKLGVSRRTIIRETGMHHSTLEKILGLPAPPGYRQVIPRIAPKPGPRADWIKSVPASGKTVHKKQRHTTRRIFHRPRGECGYTGGETVVRDLVRELRKTQSEVFMPLAQPPGEARVGFFQAPVRYPDSPHTSKVHVFAMHPPFSDMSFPRAYSRECAEVFRDGHARAFEFFGGVPARVSHDNPGIAVKTIPGAHRRELADRFEELRGHYLFEAHSRTVRRGNEKGCVEALLKYARGDFMVPAPRVKNPSELNTRLEDACRRDGARILRGKNGKDKRELPAEENLSSLPPAAFEACREEAATASPPSMIRFDGNDYSVPVAHARHALTAKGFVDGARIFSRPGTEVARHPRHRGKERSFYGPRRHLPLPAKKPGALDHAAPFVHLDLPPRFAELRRRLEDGHGHPGTKDFIGAPRLLGKRSIPRVARGIEKAMAVCRHPAVDVAKQYPYGGEHPESAVFRLDGRPQPAGVRVAAPDLSGYAQLAAREDRPWVVRRNRRCPWSVIRRR